MLRGLAATRALLCAAAAGGGEVGAAKFKQLNSSDKFKGTDKFRKHKAAERAKFRSKARHGTIMHQTESIASSMAAVTDLRELQFAQIADKIFAKGGSFVASACNIAFIPDGNPATPEVAFAGRWEVGRTALLRSLFKSKYPMNQTNNDKRREAINYFNVADVFNIAELPGFGGMHVPFHVVLQHAALLRNFVRCRPSLKMLYYCMDVSRMKGVARQDIDMLKFMTQEIPNFTIVVTKADRHQGRGAVERRQMQAKEVSNSSDSPYQDRMTETQPGDKEYVVTVEDIMDELRHHGVNHPVIFTSAFRMAGIDVLRYDMVQNCLHALPTESISLTEARKLSQRLFTLKEISAVRAVPLPITHVEEEEHYWRRELAAEDLTEIASSHHQLMLESRGDGDDIIDINQFKPSETDDVVDPDMNVAEEEEEFNADHVDHADNSSGIRNTEDTPSGSAASVVGASSARAESGIEGEKSGPMLGALDLSKVDTDALLGHFATDAETAIEALARARELSDAERNRQMSLQTLNKKLKNKELLEYVAQTSPWRNAALWPPHVLPTKSLRYNIVRNAQDPGNPYLTQSRYVAPRMDMYFRRPNVPTLAAGTKSQRAKGSYTMNSSLQKLSGPYTIPYFPDIVDVDIHADAKSFVGTMAFDSREGKVLGLLAAEHAKQGRVDPLAANPAPQDPLLAAEVQRLEQQRYLDADSAKQSLAAPNQSPPARRIAFLKPLDD